jgi:hypothetical protein
MAKLKRMFKFDGSPDDMLAFVNAYRRHKFAEVDEAEDLQDQSLIIQAMNRNARMPKAANHVCSPNCW